MDDLDPKWDSAELGRFAGSRVYSKSDNAVVEHFGPTQHHNPGDEEVARIKKWDPAPRFDWDEVLTDLSYGAWSTAYGRYLTWYRLGPGKASGAS